MKKRSATSGQPGAEEPDQLTGAVEKLTAEICVLREVLDELRQAFTWAARNDKLANAPDRGAGNGLSRNGYELTTSIADQKKPSFLD